MPIEWISSGSGGGGGGDGSSRGRDPDRMSPVGDKEEHISKTNQRRHRNRGTCLFLSRPIPAFQFSLLKGSKLIPPEDAAQKVKKRVQTSKSGESIRRSKLKPQAIQKVVA